MLYKFVKRGFDIFNSTLALIVLSPTFLVICIGIKLSSKGPVFFKSQRIGLEGKPFTMFKFRSMHIREEGTNESQYLVNSSRIFKFGNFIRKSKLDELPQLINVLKGDMTVIGPRPYPQKFIDKHYSGAYASVLSVKPGLACLDSLFDYAHGELFVTDEKQYANEVLPVKIELAKMYVERKSIQLDAYCVIKTFQSILQIVILKKRSFPYTKYENEAVRRVNENTDLSAMPGRTE